MGSVSKIINVLKRIHSFIDIVFNFIVTNVITIALIWVFFAFLLSIIYRYLLGRSLAPVEESYTLAMLYLALFGAAYSFKRKSNTTFDLVYDLMSAKVKAIIDILAKLVVIVVFCIIFKPFWKDILFYNMRKTALLKVSYMILYMPFMLILISGIYYNTYYILSEDIPKLIRAFRGDQSGQLQNAEDVKGGDGK